MAAFSVAAPAAPFGYSINSDSPTANADSLYLIDLKTGKETLLGRVQSQGQTRLDVEGLAFAPDGTLYGVDDASMTLFPINTDNGSIVSDQEVSIKGLPLGGSNDFGLTFGCDGNLYATSVGTDSLYRISLDGSTTLLGKLGANISALAAYGNPVKLYGLGNGISASFPAGSRKLYDISLLDGAAKAIDQTVGAQIASYNEAGLSFDNEGQLWAITDRRAVAEGSFASQILLIDTQTGLATTMATTTESGFESLAITVPRGCDAGNGQVAQFEVQKRFVDHNNITPVKLNISCNTGLPLTQSVTVMPNEGPFGHYEVNFVVGSFADGALSCTVTEDAPKGYTPSYTCLGESACLAAQSPDSCVFNTVTLGSENLCEIQNYPKPVQMTVIKEWLFESELLDIADTTEIQLECQNVWDSVSEGVLPNMFWTWQIKGDASQSVLINPDFAGNTMCRATESADASAVEAQNGCAAWIPIGIGDANKSCTIINTVFLEGIPALNDYGLLLFAFIMLASGTIIIRRL